MSAKTVFWFRRDLRLHDNCGLFHALQNKNVLPVFIFDPEILSRLEDKDDLRVQFIHQTLVQMKNDLNKMKSDLLVFFEKPEEVFKQLLKDHQISAVYTNHDYEPSAQARDERVNKLLKAAKVEFKTFKDQAIFEKSEVLSQAGKPYSVFTPYKNKWLEQLTTKDHQSFNLEKLADGYTQLKPQTMLSLKDLGFKSRDFSYPEKSVKDKTLKEYAESRNFPFLESGTSHLGLHFRFGTISVREQVRHALKKSDVWISELIWRDFFMQILWHFPFVVERSFRPDYEKVKWRQNEEDFKRWTEGRTGYPLVDAGMRELNETGQMHNRVRMVTASFLTKHLLIHWLKGERYFARKLLDYDLSANNGNWQWAAGTGCDAAPYFRVFNPETQAEKFDPENKYIKKWIKEFDTPAYPKPMVEHKAARERCLRAFQIALKGTDLPR